MVRFGLIYGADSLSGNGRSNLSLAHYEELEFIMFSIRYQHVDFLSQKTRSISLVFCLLALAIVNLGFLWFTGTR